MTKINKEFFKGMNPKRFEELTEEISNLEAVDNAISDIVDKEETIRIEKNTITYHELKASDLPLYKIYEGYQCKWYYRLDVIDGKQRCLKIKDDEINGIELLELPAECILDAENKDCTEQEWLLACAKVLNYITPNIKKS